MITTTAKAAISSMQRVEDLGEVFHVCFQGFFLLQNASVDTGPLPSLNSILTPNSLP